MDTVMKVYFDSMIGNPLFVVEVNSSDTVLEMKQKIQMRMGYSVSEQDILFKGEYLSTVKDNHTLQECGVVHGSFLNFFHPSIPPNPNNNNQVRFHQIQQSSKTTNVQDLSLNKNQAFQKRQRINNQASPVRFGVGNNQDLVQAEQPQEEEEVNSPYIPARFGISYQDYLDQAEQPQRKEVVSNNKPQNLRVMISVYSRESSPMRKFQVYMKESDYVEELRRELVKIREIKLPPQGYRFFHLEKLRVLEDHHSFRNSNVADGDTIMIYPSLTTNEDFSANTRIRPTNRA